VEIITWNDFVEGTYVSPIDDPARYPKSNDLDAGVVPASTLHFYHSHRGATELLAYYIDWYKSGRRPAIRRDEVFWAYHSQLLGGLKDADSAAKSVKIYGPVADVIYITANLKASATLRVTFGNKAVSISLQKGSADVQVPILACGRPHFVLKRGASIIAEGDGDNEIAASAPVLNLYYSTGFLRH
jgi:glucan endo-1,3-alpha-glucosidase